MTRNLIILCSGDSEYREYILREIAKKYRIFLLSPDRVTWESPYISDHDIIDPSNSCDVIAKALEISRRTVVTGVLTYHEPCVELVAVISQKLNLPHCGLRGASLCRDKYAARIALRAAGLPSVQCTLVHNHAEARSAAREIGYPVVVKPRALSASFGVTLVNDDSEIDAAYDCAQESTLPEPWDHRRGVLVEDYLPGLEISVDSIVQGEEVDPVIFARKMLGFSPNFEEVGHIVARPAEVVDDPDEVRAVVRAAHKAYEISNTATHTELRMTPGGPQVVEINGRSGGGLIPYLGQLATGFNLAVASADVAVGTQPDLLQTEHCVAGIRFFYATADERQALSNLCFRRSRPYWLHRVASFGDTNASLTPGRLYFSRIGYGIVTAETVESCMNRLAAMA